MVAEREREERERRAGPGLGGDCLRAWRVQFTVGLRLTLNLCIRRLDIHAHRYIYRHISEFELLAVRHSLVVDGKHCAHSLVGMGEGGITVWVYRSIYI